jgi:hypothetical protein
MVWMKWTKKKAAMTKKRTATAAPARRSAAPATMQHTKRWPMVVLLLVFGDLESKMGVVRGDKVFDRLIAQAVWLVTRVPRAAQKADAVALFYQNRVGFRAAARIVGTRDATAADLAILGLGPSAFLRKTLQLSIVKKFPQVLPMGPLVERLSFVSNKKYWGHALRSSPRIISFDDFETIVGREMSTRLRNELSTESS